MRIRSFSQAFLHHFKKILSTTRIHSMRRWFRVSFRTRSMRHVYQGIDIRRRNFIKFTLFGGAVFFAGKYFNPFINMLRGDTVIDEKIFRNFKITETGNQLKITDDGGDELLIIDKEEV